MKKNKKTTETIPVRNGSHHNRDEKYSLAIP